MKSYKGARGMKIFLQVTGAILLCIGLYYTIGMMLNGGGEELLIPVILDVSGIGLLGFGTAINLLIDIAQQKSNTPDEDEPSDEGIEAQDSGKSNSTLQ